MMRFPTGAVIGLLFIIALFAGCTTVSPPEGDREIVQPTTIDTSYPGVENTSSPNYQTEAVDASYPGLKRVIASDYLLGSISVIDPKIGSKGNFSKAQVTVKNLTQSQYELEYQYQWEDQEGFAVGSPRPWHRFALGPKELKNFSEMALQQDAKGAIFTVRMVDDSSIKENYQPEVNQYNQYGVEPTKPNYNN